MRYITKVSDSELVIPTGALPYAGQFLHRVDFANWLACWNLVLAQGMWSIDDLLSTSSDYTYPRYRDIEIVDLIDGRFHPPTGSPHAMETISYAAAIRGAEGEAFDELRRDMIEWEPDKTLETLRRSDIELALEELRRSIAPNAASRLTCLWVVQDSASGARLLAEMFGNRNYPPITVQVPWAVRVTQADPRWLDVLTEESDVQAARRYWSGERYSADERWEYLIEGEIRATVPAQLDYIWTYCAKPPRPFLLARERDPGRAGDLARSALASGE